MKITIHCLRRSLTLLVAVAAVHPVLGATSFLWSQATPGPNNWNVNANWTPSTGNPGPGDTAIFGLTGTVSDNLTVNNVVSVNNSINTLQFTNTGAGVWHVSQIPSGVTLTVTNNMTVGGLTTATAASLAAMSGGGTLLVTGNTLQVGQGNLAAALSGNTLDLSGLSNFVYGASSGTISVGSGNRSAGNWLLAAVSNSISAGTVNLNSASSSSSTSGTITLGSGTNQINAGTINVAAGNTRSACTVQFPAASATGGLRVRGSGGTDADRATMTMGNRQASGSGGTTTANLNLNGHAVDFKLNTLTVGQSGNVTANTGTGNLNFDTGTIDATNVNMAAVTVAGSTANGNITIGTNSAVGLGGTLVVGAGGISMANQSAGTANGTLTLNGGALICSGSITKTTVGGTATINLNGGMLSLGDAATIGASAAPIDGFNVSDSALTLPAASSRAEVIVSTLTPGGSANVINISSVPGIAVFPAQFPIIAYTSLGGTYNFVLGTMPGTYQGYLSNNTSSVDLVVTNSLSKSDTWNGNVNGNWDTTTLNWRSSGNAVNYLQGDNVTFDDTLTGTTSVNLTMALLPGAIGVNNSTKNYVFSGSGKLSGAAVLTKQGTGSLTLAETGGDDFSGGIVVDAGTLILDNTNSSISGGLAVNGGTMQIGNNDANGTLPSGTITDNGALIFQRSDNVTVSSSIAGTGTLTQNGTGTLTLSGVNSYSGSTTVGNGTLALSGSGTISNSSSVGISSATFDVSALGQPTTVGGLNLNNATITVAVGAGGATNILSSSLNFGGAANHLNVSGLPAIASYPVTFTIIQSAAAAGGTFNLSVGNLPAASPAYAAQVSLSGDHTAVLLTVTSGPVGARPAVLWVGADVPNLNTNWSDRLNWQLPGAPGFGENVFFNTTAAQSASALSTPGGGTAALTPDNLNNIVDANFTISSLTYTNLGGSYHNTYINTGKTLNLTNTGGLMVGGLDAGATTQQEFATISGGNATLNVAATNGNVQVWVGSGTAAGSQATLDMSALDTFDATVSRFLVGATIGNVVNRPSGVLYLAKTNTIKAGFQTTTIEAGTTTANAAIVAADCNGNAGSPSFIYLGLANSISADTIGIGRQKASAHLIFNPIYANIAPYPSVTLQGFSSGLVSIFDVGDGAGNTGTTTLTGEANFTGGFVNAAVDTVNVGRASGGASGSGTTTGVLNFDAGTITANTLNIGLQPVTGSKVGVGSVGVGSNTVIGASGNLIVRGNLTLGVAGGGAGAATTSGTLGITNGTVQAFAIVPGTNSLSAITLAGGRLTVTNVVGNPAGPLGTLNLMPLNTADNVRNTLSLPVRTNSPGVTVSILNIDGLDTTTNIINVESVGPIGTVPVELPLIQYTTMNLVSGGTFNVGLGTLPTGYAGVLTNDTTINAIALVLTAALHPQPVMTTVNQAAPNLVIQGVNGFANVPYYMLASTNVALPLSQWTRVATNVFGPNGQFSSTVSAAVPQQFFQLQVAP
jgi:autotransporter-associated beta strand protein